MRKLLCGVGIISLNFSCGNSPIGSSIRDLSIARGIAEVSLDLRNPSKVTFLAKDAEGITSPVVHEFGGTIEFDITDSSLTWNTTDGNSVVVGFAAKDEADFCTGKFSDVCDLSIGRKAGDEKYEATGVIFTANLVKRGTSLAAEDVNDMGLPIRMTELNKFVLPSPDQEDAGSCLYMSSAGAVEVLLNKNPATRSLSSEGDTDLSERYLMNAGANVALDYWLTDTVLLFNEKDGGALNRDFRYTKGWFKTGQSGTKSATRNEQGASYGTKYNWINGISSRVEAAKVSIPTVKRKVIYRDPDENQWNTGIMNPEVITSIKQHLATKKTPVMIVYNHFGYWHAVAIVGYDDSVEHGGCSFVNSYLKEMAGTPNQSESIKKIERMKKTHGCATKGVFYVRDSIYAGNPENVYDYDPASTNDESPYTKPIVEHEYEWALYLGNHAYTVEF